MKRVLCLSLLVTLASRLPIHAQEKDAPPKNFTNGIDMKFVWIPPGNFLMGSPKEETSRGNETQHKVTLTKGFYMGVYPVTQAQYKAVMGKDPSQFKGEKSLPVHGVTWDDCQEFIKKLREKDKKSYRLPTEAQWEYACRAGTKTPFYFGEMITTDQANYAKGKERGKPMPVGSFPANTFGLYDMHGNVRQFCQDWYGEYPQTEVVDPEGPKSGEYRVLRNGSYHRGSESCRSANRNGREPEFRDGDVGFRICFSVE
jgi:formylglycine-generating enzyme required for sulfatase activity